MHIHATVHADRLRHEVTVVGRKKITVPTKSGILITLQSAAFSAVGELLGAGDPFWFGLEMVRPGMIESRKYYHCLLHGPGRA